MDVDSDPLFIQTTQVSKAVNRRFRGGKNRQRPAINETVLTFDTPESETLFRNGNVQLVQPYLKTKVGRQDGLIVSVAGTVFYISLVNETGNVYKIADGNNKSVMHAFGVQAEEWYYIQDGQNQPIFWNGLTTSPSVRSDPTKKQMPIGTVMCYAQGRIYLTNQYNEMRASDIMFGDGTTNTNDVQNFTEIEYWNGGGFFSIPSYMGQVTGMVVLSTSGVNQNGQGELLVFCENGCQAFDVSQPRTSWVAAQIQKTVMTGRGCIAPYSVASVNGEAWYRTSDGWSSFSNDRIDISQKDTFRKFSREINYWLDQDTPHLRRYGSMIFFDNRVLGTVSPQLSLPRDLTKGYGSHRYFRGICVVDLDRYSKSLSQAMNFDGLWTGIRPTGMAVVRDKAFAMSYDADGINRLYQITKVEGNDNSKKKVSSFYITKAFVCPPLTEFNQKRIVGGELWLSDVADRVQVNVAYRPDHFPGWTDLLPPLGFGADTPSDVDFPLTEDRQKKWQFPAPEPDVVQDGTDRLMTTGSIFQAKVSIVGSAKVDRMRIKVEPNDEAEVFLQEDCPADEQLMLYKAIGAQMENDYEYLIVNG